MSRRIRVGRLAFGPLARGNVRKAVHVAVLAPCSLPYDVPLAPFGLSPDAVDGDKGYNSKRKRKGKTGFSGIVPCPNRGPLPSAEIGHSRGLKIPKGILTILAALTPQV